MLNVKDIFTPVEQVRNPPSNLCLDTLQKDEKTVFDMGIYSCQNGASANEVCVLIGRFCCSDMKFNDHFIFQMLCFE